MVCKIAKTSGLLKIVGVLVGVNKDTSKLLEEKTCVD